MVCNFPVFFLFVVSAALHCSDGFSQEEIQQFGLTEFEKADQCYDANGNAQRCHPEFVNAAFNVKVEATSTCGVAHLSEYCTQTGAHGIRRECNKCDDHDPAKRHPPEYLTDFNNNENETWWQSETMYERWPNQVNLTLRLRKAFEIVYMRLKFKSPRPESFAIYKKTSEDGEWIPYQYYSATCRDFYGLPDLPYVRGPDETRALCTSDYSDISPLTGGNVAFSTLEGRPSAFNFVENSRDLQNWVTATDIMISLDRMNTFGDEVFEDSKVLKSYYYAITDFAVGGKCKCNGHAAECITSGDNGDKRLICHCEHNTAGPDCNECLPFFNDQPWGVATLSDAHECKACNCNGFSEVCYFDQKLHQATGHGGHCTDCRGNRDGPRCERCKENFHQRGDETYCVPCFCNEQGSTSLQCDVEGKCQCKPGVGGDKCDRCESNYYDLSPQGCKPCLCEKAGSLRNEPKCDVSSGICHCKANVEGQRCDSCKPGFFNLDLGNDFGCTPCFCFGHSALCGSAPGYGQVKIASSFDRNQERWTAEELHTKSAVPVQYSSGSHNIGVTALGSEPVYFLAPDRFLGDQRGSYNQILNFTFHVGEHNPRPSAEDIIIEGGGFRVARPIFGNGNTLPSLHPHEFTFRLHEHADFGWNPQLTSRDFMSILANISSIRIRASYTTRGSGYLDDIMLQTARRGAAGPPAPWVESCTCPEGYIGQFCESCAPGYTHEPKNGGPFSRCVPCICNGHSDMCDPESGQCICEDNTGGEHCERCARGFYGNSLKGTENDCQSCPCPNNGACIQLADSQIVCLECPTGYAGPLCEYCGDGFYGDPSGLLGPKTECRPCDCNENIDPNAVGNCNRTTGECIKCIYNTGGPRCDHCLAGFFGDALALPKGDCKACECNSLGTEAITEGVFVCEQPHGQCPCKPNVIGRQCDTCQGGYFDLASGEGCKDCACNPVGSHNKTCNVRSGQCHCRAGVVGLRCTDCAPSHYGFSTEGCKPCDCDSIGSLSLQCSPDGQCPCKSSVEGRACDRCKENKYNREAGCVDCPFCYNLIQDAVTEHRKKLTEMEKLLEDISSTPTVIDDLDFETKLSQVGTRIEELWRDAQAANGEEGGSLVDKIAELKEKVLSLDDQAKGIKSSIDQCSVDANEIISNLTIAADRVSRADDSLKQASRFLESDGKEALAQAREKARQFGLDEQSETLSEMAREARTLADAHEAAATRVEQTAQKAVNLSTEAYEIAYNAFNTQRNATDESREMLLKAQQLEAEVGETEAKAKEALAKAKAAYDEALTLYQRSVSLSLPAVNLDDVRNKAIAAKTTAEKLKKAVSELLKERKAILEQAKEKADSGRGKIEASQAYQQNAEELLADLDKAKRSAEEARETSERTFSEARKIHTTLQDFHRNFEDSKTNATIAKEKIPAIQQFIRDAREQTRANAVMIASAQEAATKALRDAEEAKEIAVRAAEEADAISSESARARKLATEIREDTNTLSVRISDTAQRMTTTEEKVNQDEQQIEAVLLKATEAESQSGRAFTIIKSALEEVGDISLALDNLEQINEDGLKNLELKIQTVDKELKVAGIDEKLQELRLARNKQIAWINTYTEELKVLKKEVENIREIRAALPPETKCYNRLRLEP